MYRYQNVGIYKLYTVETGIDSTVLLQLYTSI